MFKMDSESIFIQMESIESECAALLASWKRLEVEAGEALDVPWTGVNDNIRRHDEGRDFNSALIRVSEASMKYHRCRLKLARSKSPCDEEECRRMAWHAQCAENAAEASRQIRRECTWKKNQEARTSKTITGQLLQRMPNSRTAYMQPRMGALHAAFFSVTGPEIH